MRCAWDAYMAILPVWMRQDVDRHGKDTLQELRLRLGSPPELRLKSKHISLARMVLQEDLNFVIQTASRYSPWAASTMAHGYLTAPGGHRIGICGEAVCANGAMSAVRNPTSLCIRTARQLPGLADMAAGYGGSVLIIGRPGSGKTTLLRELIHILSDRGSYISVVDERGELFPRWNGISCFDAGRRTDIMTGCTKVQGIDCVLRTMSPSYIAVDEVTAEEDCNALIRAAWCGVKLLATAHASDRSDLMKRPVYQKLMHRNLFDTLLIMQPDQSWRAERMDVCLSNV